MTTAREHLDALTAVLMKNGIQEWVIDDQGRHYRLLFMVNGKKRFYVFPRSASDHRAVKNAVSDLRKMIEQPRQAKPAKVKQKRHAIQRKPVKAPDLPPITVKKDPWEALVSIKPPAPQPVTPPLPPSEPTIWRRLWAWVRV